MKTPEISVLQAEKEIVVFGEKMQKMFSLLHDLYNMEDEQEFTKLFERIQKAEDYSDRMENEIGHYLGEVGEAHLSDDTKAKIRSMLRQIGELESVGDSCFNLARIIRRKRENKIAFTKQQEEGLVQMSGLLDQALGRMNDLLSGRDKNYVLAPSDSIELQINGCRNSLKQQNIENLDNHVYGYDNGTVFTDLINEYEKTGDYVINVVEARLGVTKFSVAK